MIHFTYLFFSVVRPYCPSAISQIRFTLDLSNKNNMITYLLHLLFYQPVHFRVLSIINDCNFMIILNYMCCDSSSFDVKINSYCEARLLKNTCSQIWNKVLCSQNRRLLGWAPIDFQTLFYYCFKFFSTFVHCSKIISHPLVTLALSPILSVTRPAQASAGRHCTMYTSTTFLSLTIVTWATIIDTYIFGYHELQTYERGTVFELYTYVIIIP